MIKLYRGRSTCAPRCRGAFQKTYSRVLWAMTFCWSTLCRLPCSPPCPETHRQVSKTKHIFFYILSFEPAWRKLLWNIETPDPQERSVGAACSQYSLPRERWRTRDLCSCWWNLWSPDGIHRWPFTYVAGPRWATWMQNRLATNCKVLPCTT